MKPLHCLHEHLEKGVSRGQRGHVESGPRGISSVWWGAELSTACLPEIAALAHCWGAGF